MLTSLTRRTRLTATAAACTAALAVGGVCLASGAADAGAHRAVPAPPTVPTRADQIQNVDQVKTAIKGYYGDTLTSTPDPTDTSKKLHEPAANGSWAKETDGVGRAVRSYLARQGTAHDSHAKKKVLLLDVDDTSLVTYDYEISTSFVYNPATNAQFVNAAVFPKVPGTQRTARYAAGHGYTVIYLTGRPEAQRAGTLRNLQRQGFPVSNATLYLKDAGAAYLSSCAPSCSTVQTKSLTRRYIESKGYRITANVGDQYSDLKGGYAKRTFKLPNPMYYLP